jgi:uncharacterized protein (DUF362 family)/Pyruvate/2-oxoacid:ferredoxin oxidoreductase delta subunit
MGKVAIYKCGDYEYNRVLDTVAKVLDDIPSIKLLRPGWVLVKINLLKLNKPEDGVTTHPFVVEGVVRYLQGLGHHVLIGDSPGGPFNPVILKAIYDASGIASVAARTGCELNFRTDSIDVKPQNSKLVHSLKLVKAFTEVDYVISCAKLKTHTMMTYTGAVKNLFGMIPGVTKADYHLKLNDIAHFADMLLDVCDYVRPDFSIIDGIHAMEGDGPSSGDIRELGLLLAGESPYELDHSAAKIAGLSNVPTIIQAEARGLFDQKDIEYTNITPEELTVIPFRLPGSTHVNFVKGRIPKYVENFLLDSIRPYPMVKKDFCVGCGICARNCPPKVISMVDHKPVIDTEHCIRCFCCHELCPEKAIGIKRHPLHRLVFGK